MQKTDIETAGFIAPPPSDDDAWESRLVWEFFGRKKNGMYVEVGANHPFVTNQTWFLEQQGWSGILIEPNLDWHESLCKSRPGSLILPVAAGAPEQAGEGFLHLAGTRRAHSKVKTNPDPIVAVERIRRVPVRTLDVIFTEAGIGRVDFLSIDIGGAEIEVLRGLDFTVARPELIVIEDFFYNHVKHHYLIGRGYKLVRRTSCRNWYVPKESPCSLFSVSTKGDLWHLFRKMWLAPPFNNLRRTFRQWRPPRKKKKAKA